MTRLSVVIITLNEEANIGDCLESVKWADEIIVMDSCSRDSTVEIAKQYTSKVYQHEFLGDGPMKNLGIQKASNDWILVLDADERVSPELRTEIERVLESADCDGYKIPYKVYFLGRWMKHGGFWPQHHLRLFRKDRCRFNEIQAHAGVITNRRTRKLQHFMLHYTCHNLSDYIAKLNSHSDLIAVQEKRSAWIVRSFLRGWTRFTYMYVFRAGFLDGREGFIASTLVSYYSLIKHLKMWEKNRNTQ